MLNDIIIFKKIKEGDIKTFEKLFRHYYVSLCLFAFSITGRKDVSEEVVQEVFYNIWKDRDRIEVLHSVKSYLYGAVKNHSLRYKEHLLVQERHHEYIINQENSSVSYSPQEELEYKELQEAINRTILKLPERRMQIFRMHRIDGKKYKEIADRFSISIKTVEAEMTKAYRTLRQEIEKIYYNNGF